MKKIFTIVFLAIFFFTPIVGNFCLATGPPIESEKGIKYCCEQDHTDHHQNQTTCRDKVPCQYDHSCCGMTLPGTILSLSFLDFHTFIPTEILFSPFQMVTSLFHPPRPQL